MEAASETAAKRASRCREEGYLEEENSSDGMEVEIKGTGN